MMLSRSVNAVVLDRSEAIRLTTEEFWQRSGWSTARRQRGGGSPAITSDRDCADDAAGTTLVFRVDNRTFSLTADDAIDIRVKFGGDLFDDVIVRSLVASSGARTIAAEPAYAAFRNTLRRVMKFNAAVSAEAMSDVRNALADRQWQFRTPEGIARSTGRELSEVQRTLRALGDQVRRPTVPDKSGRDLYTLASRSPSWKERYWTFVNAIATW